jgi:hypothetical protein
LKYILNSIQEVLVLVPWGPNCPDRSPPPALRGKFKEATVTFFHILHDSSFTVELPCLSVLPQQLVKDHERTE